MDQIAKQFGLDTQALCELNQLKNCSNICSTCSSLKIPVKGGKRRLQ
jgi:hypothetical protein